MQERETLLQLKQISKHFGGVKALDGVDLTLRKGEIHCLAGENGSGKSTLIKIVSGFYKPDGGEIGWDGKTYDQLSIIESIRQGIQVIYQDLSVFPNLTVMENIAMNYELYNRKKFVNWNSVRDIAQKSLQHIGVDIPLGEEVEHLSVADKQLVAIARSILYNARLIIMDEPTSALTRNEVDKLFKVIRQLQNEGITILFVSHKLDEVFEIADRFTVLRNGKLIVTDDAANVDNDRFIYYMTGREIKEDYFTAPTKTDACLFRVEGLGLQNAFEDISFSIEAGEILGITGLLGSGRTELAKALFGLYKADKGQVYVEGEPVPIRSPQDAMAHGIAYLPEDRLSEGLFLTQSIRNNLAASAIDGLVTRRGTIDENRVDQEVAHWVDTLSIKLNDSGDLITTLSGGNQQKVVLGKWLATKPKVLVLNGPTVGVDIGSKFDIHTFLRALAAQNGMAIILISDDIAEVLKNCNRILIINKGRIVEEHVNTTLDEAGLTAKVTSRVQGGAPA